MRRLTKYENLLALTKYANIHEAKAAYEKSANLTAEYLYIPFFSVNDSLVAVTESEIKTFYVKMQMNIKEMPLKMSNM